MRASEFIINPDTTLIGKLAKTGKIVQVLKQKQGPAFAKDPDEVWTLIDTDPSRTNKISDNAKWIPADTEFEWVREYLKKIDEGFARKLNFDEIYGKYLKVTDNNGDPNKEGFSLVTPLNGDSWNWRERPEFIPLVKKKLNQPGFLRPYKYKQIIDSMAGKQFDPATHLAKEELDEGLRDWIAALAATGAMALGTPAVAKQVPTTTAVSQQAYNQISQALATPAAQTLKKTAIKAGIVGTELAQFMAQCAHETANFTSLEEFGGSLDFRKYDPKYNPRKARQLGNKVAGDGAKYKGRGFIQLTGRDNYKRAGQALGLPLERQPELVERPDVAAKVAVWFWQNRVAPKVASFHDTQQATKPINPAMRGLSDRHTKFNAIKQGAMAQPKDMAPRGRRI